MTAAVEEPARRTPLLGEFEVCVLGGGPAGLAAAVSAARGGARTLLVERYGFLGGMGTAGGVTNFAGLYGRRKGQMQQLVHGVVDGLLERIERLGGLNLPQDGLQGRIRVRSYDIAAYKCAADDWLLASGVQLLFHALAVGCTMAGGHIDALLVETRSGRRAIRAYEFIDASGDGDLAMHAGVPFELGDGAGSGLYPGTMARFSHVEPERALAAVGDFRAIDALMNAAAGRWRFPRRGAILRPQRNPSEWRANVTQLANDRGQAVDATDALQLSAAEVEGRRQIVEYWRFLRAEVPGFERCEIAGIAPQVGIRESRRIVGAHVLTEAEVLGGARFDDAIGLNGWPLELHVAGGLEWRFHADADNAYHQLPFAMLVPPQVANLLVAGRCASMTHEGQSAARVSGGCFVMGQAAGSAAALRAAGRFHPAALRRSLLDAGVDLD